MAMRVMVKTGGNPGPIEKQMSSMTRGEVCYHIQNDYYVVRIGAYNETSQFLILRDDETCDHYDFKASGHHKVRELYPGENVTVNFS